MLTKKWLFVGVFTLLSLSLATAAPPAVHPATGAPLVITCYRGTPEALDGDLSDWNLDAMTPAVLDSLAQIYTGQASWTGPADCSGKFYLQWDDKNVYIGVIVKDDTISMNKSNGDIWNADAIEVFFGTTNAVAPHAEHYQYGFNANNQYWNWCNMDSGGQTLPNYMQVASKRIAGGYVCEAAIDHTQIKNLKWTVGNTLGFHPVIDDTEAADREIQITWTGREAHDQSLGFGYLILSGDPALPKGVSRAPIPANKAVDVPVDAVLSWTAGKYPATHDVYFGTSLNDVNSASRTKPAGVLASQGQADPTFDPPGLMAYGQTYYWRVDEVNTAADATIYKGSVWSFTTESYGFPIKNVTATASSNQNGMGPENTVNGSGMTGDLHGSNPMTMWMSTGIGANWIQFKFDKAYKLYDMKVWNSNQPVEGYIGFSARKVTVEYSTDGTTWTAVDNVPEFGRGTGLDGYAANTDIKFGGVMAQYVKLTINANWGGMSAVTGLSEVQFSSVPVQAFGPQPADGAKALGLSTTLSWRAGREAASHKVFFGTDQAAVTNGAATAKSVTTHTFDPGALSYGTTYYWKVDEVNTVTYPGDVWSFTTQEFAVVDDFESYNDKDNCIFDTWIDGYTDKKSGSTVGYMNAPFAEQTIVHAGIQSMPMEYNNVKAPYYSEATRTFDTPQNWTASGGDTVAFWFRGRAAGFLDNGNNTFTLSSSGTDVWNNGDQFRFAYKTLTGDGSIVARVDSVVNTNAWAKAGVMIRQTTDAGSAHAFMPITPGGSGAGNGASFQRRLVANGVSTNDDKPAPAIAAPYWVKVERKGNSFTGSISPDGKTWTQLGTAQTISMNNPVLIGLAVCSHDAALTTTAVFSNVSATGNVSGSWQSAAIGAAMPTNSAAPLYLTVEDKAGKSKTVVNADPAAVVTVTWTEWRIPLSSLTGVNLAAVQKIVIGVGDKASPKAGAAGMLYVDDIGYGHPAK